MIFISKYLVPRGYLGIALYPFVFLRFKELKQNNALINHEKIHLRQQLELLILPFYVLYCVEFLVRLTQFKNFKLAYKNISFEREAYINENNLEYLKSRLFFSFIKYL